MARSDVPAERPGGPGASGSIPLARAPRPTSVTLRKWVVDWWAGGGGAIGRTLRLLTLPLEYGFKKGSGLRNDLYDRGIFPLQRAPIPVISIGNLTVGGSGKTPISAWLVKELRRRGAKPALLARGYGQDEMILHRRWNPDCLVLAEEDRAYGAWKAAKRGASAVVLDDGFQHRRLARDLDIVLVPCSTPRSIRLLPRGPFREGFSALARAGVVILTQKGYGESALEMEMRLEPFLREPPVKVAFVHDAWTDLNGGPAPDPAGDYLAVCGIGDPTGFSRVLGEALGRPGELMTFPDHHAYTWGDVAEIQSRLQGRTLVTTEKDAVKLHTFRGELPGLRVSHLRVEFLAGEDRLWEHVDRVVNSASRRLKAP